jgi:hypothetical protein
MLTAASSPISANNQVNEERAFRHSRRALDYFFTLMSVMSFTEEKDESGSDCENDEEYK